MNRNERTRFDWDAVDWALAVTIGALSGIVGSLIIWLGVLSWPWL